MKIGWRSHWTLVDVWVEADGAVGRMAHVTYIVTGVFVFANIMEFPLCAVETLDFGKVFWVASGVEGRLILHATWGWLGH